jgi:hypothetical protein
MKIHTMSVLGAVAASALVGRATAGLVDPFLVTQSATVSASGTGSSASETSSAVNLSGSLFASRRAVASNWNGTSASVTGSGAFNYQVQRSAAGGSIPSAELRYATGLNGTDATPIDMTNISGFSFDLGNAVGSVHFTILLFDAAGADHFMEATSTDGANGSYNFIMNPAAGTFDRTQVMQLSLIVDFGYNHDNSNAGPASGTISNLEYSVVPAPGALALLGATGVVGGRRRRA